MIGKFLKSINMDSSHSFFAMTAELKHFSSHPGGQREIDEGNRFNGVGNSSGRAELALAGLTPEAGQGANAASANGDHPPRPRPRGATSAELRAEAQRATQRVDREGFRLAMRLLELRNFFDFGVDRTALVEDSLVCSICQVDFERNDSIMPWPGPCGDSAALAVQPHIFHRACLANYVASNLRLLEEQNESLPCPICRSGSRRSVEFGAE